MNWWKPWHKPPKDTKVEPLVCSECGVLFKPHGIREVVYYGHGGYRSTVEMLCHPQPEYSNLCKTHRDPKLALDARKKVVTDWALENWEKLEKRALKELKVAEAKRSRTVVGACDMATKADPRVSNGAQQYRLSGYSDLYNPVLHGFGRYAGGL